MSTTTLPPIFVEFVCGGPGAGKSTYCEAKRQLLVAASPDMDAPANADRHLVHVNLDPANDCYFPYPCVIDICDLIELRHVAETENLGPNGSYLFCVDYIAQHTQWLLDKLVAEARKCAASDRAARRRALRPVWFMVDCPGQVEFYIRSTGLSQLVKDLTKKLRCQVCMTHLCDAAVATRDVPSYVSTCLLCLTAMTDVELPQINVLSKWDRAMEQAKDLLMLLRAGGSGAGAGAGGGAGGGAASSSSRRQQQQQQQPPPPDDEDVEEWLEPFCNASVFSSEHFDAFWRDTQVEKTCASQASMRSAMVQRCGGAGAAARHRRAPEPQEATKATASTSSENNQQQEPQQESTQQAETAAVSSPPAPANNLLSLTKTILSVVEGYNLVGFSPLDVNNADIVQQLCLDVDNAIGFMMHAGLSQ